jgi:HD-GYP domain-containing protein (c-di-GMP phosphodiesterase class II)
MKVNRNDFVSAFAMALDFLEASFRLNIMNHNKRVAIIAIRLGEQLGLSNEDMFDLYAAATLHDNGMTNSIYTKLESGKASALEKSAVHCIRGESNLEHFPFLKPRKGVILYHHEAFDGSGFFGIAGDNIPLLAHIIHFADITEMLYNKGADRKTIETQVAVWKGTGFSPILCEAFEAVSARLCFWLSLDSMFIENELARSVPRYQMELNLSEIFPIACIISKIIDEKSPFTGRHSQGIAEISAVMTDFYNFDEDRKLKFLIAAHLHDTGKLAVPNAILDKPCALTVEEFELVKPHTFYTRKTLEHIVGFEDITEWASNHHEKLNGTGYPYGLSEKELDFESRLMTCIDIYQALTEERPYRKPLEHKQVAAIMFDMANQGGISREIANDVLEANR